MTSTVRLPAGVIGALLTPGARLYEMNAAFGAVIVCVAFATTMEVMMATTVAMRMTPGRENFWIRVLIAFILFGFLLCWFSYVSFFGLRFFVSRLEADFVWNQRKRSLVSWANFYAYVDPKMPFDSASLSRK